MKRLAFILPLVLACAISAAEAQNDKISSIAFEGLKNVKERTVKEQIKSKTGKPYSDDTVKADIQNILGLGSFENVEAVLDTSTYRLTFQVREKPYIKKITIKGNKKISTGKLKDEITLKEKEFFDYLKLDESQTKMLNLYRDKGYADAKIEVYPTTDETTNQMTITFLVTEGNRILIDNVSVEGVHAYKPKKILKMMKTKRKKVYKEETIQEDIRTIEKFYKNNGYIDVSIEAPKISYNADRTSMYITLVINEGPRFKIGALTFSGNTIFSEQELKKAVTLKPGQLYNEDRLNESRAAIMEMYSNKGYLHAQVEPEFQPDAQKGEMTVSFAITENDIVYLGNVYVDGLTFTKEFVIRREVDMKEGDVFSASKIRRSIEKIYNLGFIDSVEPEIQPTEKPDVMDLVLSVTEGKPGILSAGAGYSSVDQLVGTLQAFASPGSPLIRT
jgi:outer membrane protein insertion porin family